MFSRHQHIVHSKMTVSANREKPTVVCQELWKCVNLPNQSSVPTSYKECLCVCVMRRLCAGVCIRVCMLTLDMRQRKQKTSTVSGKSNSILAHRNATESWTRWFISGYFGSTDDLSHRAADSSVARTESGMTSVSVARTLKRHLVSVFTASFNVLKYP